MKRTTCLLILLLTPGCGPTGGGAAADAGADADEVVDASPADAGPDAIAEAGTDAGADAGPDAPSSPFGFTPSNIDPGQLTLTGLGDLDIAGSCTIDTETETRD